MGKLIISENGRFEWDEDKDMLNRKNHGLSFSEILEVFDDPAFLEAYDIEHSTVEERYYGIGCISGVIFIVVFYTERGKRTRIFSARLADNDDKETYNDYFKKINS